ncbi:MAG: hypothetical protein QOH25_3994 [Acidobacteriota bacterium]|jgi:hypothetical protein|nr:hypothetical protein [Acidobacteriota bacterium]
MRRKLFMPVFASLFLSLAFALPVSANERATELARLAVSEKPMEANPAIAELRAMGPAGLQVLFETYGEEIKRAAAGLSVNEPEWRRLSAALDAVSQQRNSYSSGLYWYTDFDEAKRAAKASGKPILSLRLLGNLNEEFSCANSRFFRAVLYANTDVSKYLREHFILHWKSVRPAPRVTIDFGDGRRLERTLTGNSIHYVLDTNGLPVDALPGLYGPAAFLRGLNQAETIARQVATKDAGQRWEALRAYHNARIQTIAADWAADVARTGGKVPADVAARIERRKSNPGAIEIAPLAITKRVVEVDILKAITADATALEAATDISSWNKIAALHAPDVRLDKGSIAFITRQNQSLRADDALLSRTLQNLEQYLSLDTARNEYMMHTKLHGWFATGMALGDVERLNERVYAELFQTPRSDPWLGLYSPDVYTALDNGGISKN